MDFKTAFTTLVNTPHSFTCLMAPMGWGKTRQVWDLLEQSPRIVFLCPLRSIVEELSEREHAFALLGDEKKQVFDNFIKAKKGVLVSTVESLPLLSLLGKNEDFLYVFDEFHLFYAWGESFRERLYDSFIEVLGAEARVLVLTATAHGNFLDRLKGDLALTNYQSFFVDLGNFKLKYEPQKTYVVTKCQQKISMWWSALFFFRGRVLYFFATKRELYDFREKLRQAGVESRVCIGGEVKDFCLREQTSRPRIVLATSALSHGVNIRNIRRIYLTYEPEDFMKAQMIGRGGRFGEGFTVFELAKNGKQSSLVKKWWEKALYRFYESIIEISKVLIYGSC
jgi:ATP-dependent DNA helicase RecQ